MSARRRVALGVLAALALWVAVAAIALFAPRAAGAAGGDVILLHGWNGNAADWSTAKAAYEAKGYTVHALQLPRAGGQAGDTAANADYVQRYMTDHGITSAALDSHSLGGWLALTVALTRQDTRVTSVVLRDSGYCADWLACFVVPDMREGSPIVRGVQDAPASAVPVLHLSSKTAVLPQVDCTKTYSGYSHPEYQTRAVFSTVATAWPGTNPCAPAATPTATPTSTPAITPTATPTSTPTPSCSWLARLWGWC